MKLRIAQKVAAAIAIFAIAGGTTAVHADEVIATEEETYVGEEVETPEPEPAAKAPPPSPSWLAITTDIIIGRPTLLMATVAGGAFYVVSLPVTLASGSESTARDIFLLPAQQLVETPFGGALTPKG